MRFDKGLLRDILGILVIPDRYISQSNRPFHMSPHKFREGLFVPLSGRSNEIGIATEHDFFPAHELTGGAADRPHAAEFCGLRLAVAVVVAHVRFLRLLSLPEAAIFFRIAP